MLVKTTSVVGKLVKKYDKIGYAYFPASHKKNTHYLGVEHKT